MVGNELIESMVVSSCEATTHALIWKLCKVKQPFRFLYPRGGPSLTTQTAHNWELCITASCRPLSNHPENMRPFLNLKKFN